MEILTQGHNCISLGLKQEQKCQKTLRKIVSWVAGLFRAFDCFLILRQVFFRPTHLIFITSFGKKSPQTF